MIFPKVMPFLQKSSVGKSLRIFPYMCRKYSVGNFEGKRFLRTETNERPSDFWDRNTYSVLPSSVQGNNLRSYLRKPHEITPNMWFSNETRDEFMSYYPEILKQLQDMAATYDDVDHGQHIAKVLNYIIPGGRRYAGIMTVETYKMLLPESKRTPENIKLGYYLGWCVELLIEHVVMGDDIMDGGQIRRTRKCWHLLDDVKLAAVNDGCIIETGMYCLLRKTFGHHDCFLRLLEIFNESAFSVYIGQHIDIKYSKDIFNMTLPLYRTIVRNAATYIVSYQPVVLGMTLAGYTSPEVAKETRYILTQLGYYYLIENDYMDCFADLHLKGKNGRDIETGRCRWPIVVFMEKATPEQKKLMRTHYGQDNEESVAVVKQLLEEVNIHQIYANYAAELYHNLMEDIQRSPNDDLKRVYMKLVEIMTCSTEAGGVFP
ncbi:uncharacterized protein LOC129795597 isoform X2 [Lutzomyia longipalpis]|uniref:uncharacterized protein LOC129795597 isoform X2 n=1 Tax=Lutzomyia longipalpis TaxID=7200 RepID=UPI002483C4FA|nr:uncharacterized protein LOC129795597 isoform X2 [Lutzomyia longipalpis]